MGGAADRRRWSRPALRSSPPQGLAGGAFGRRRWSGLAALLLLVGAAGCGGEDGPTAAAWADQAQARCAQARPAEERIRARQRRLQTLGDRDRFFPAAAAATDDDVALDRRVVAELELLERPVDRRDDLERWLLAVRQRITVTATLAAAYRTAARTGDERAIGERSERADALDEADDGQAGRLGVGACAAVV